MRFTTWALALCLTLGLMGWASDAVAGKGKPAPSPGAGDSGLILPVSLGTSADCKSADGTGLNNGTYPNMLRATGFGYGCSGNYNQPLTWALATGMIRIEALPPATSGSARAVSDAGTVIGYTKGSNDAFVWPAGGPMQRLPTLTGTMYAMAESVDATGKYIVGMNSTTSSADLVLWTDKLSSGTWEVESLDPDGTYPVAVAGDRTTVSNRNPFGTFGAQALVFEANSNQPSGLGAGTVANDISQDGNLIVGFRWEACVRPDCEYEVPVFWTRESSGKWAMHDLPALDGVDSEARGVGMVGGKAVIVGYGYTKKDAIMRAVAWIPGADGKYDLPIRLAALGGKAKAWATAEDVNVEGVVVGTSASTGLNRVAVLWRLPN